MSRTHQLKPSPSTVHWGYFGTDVSPALVISSGDTVEIESYSYPRGLDYRELRVPELDAILNEVQDIGPGPHILTGPVYVESAYPGTVLAVHIEHVEPLIPYGYNMIRPGIDGFGMLPDDFPVGRLKVFALDETRGRVRVADRVSVPIRPFFGTVGVCPSNEKRWNSRVPGEFGGNMDISELTAGSTLYLPVFVPGALLSVGDGHAAQGDGEVDLSGIEISMRGRLQIEVRHDLTLERPMVETPTNVITTGFHEDLDEAARIATRDMISWLRTHQGLDALDAYTLCSIALSLRVSQVVNLRKGIHAMLPKTVLEG